MLDELTNFLSVPLTRRTQAASSRLLGATPTDMGTVMAIGDAAAAYNVMPMIPLNKVTLIVEDSSDAASVGSKKTKTKWWFCPKTHLQFPTSLDSYFPTQERMVLTAADVYTKNVFTVDWKVYAVALYASEEFRRDPGMEIYRSFQPTELASDEFFFNSLLSTEKPYSRSLVLKLAMDLKCSMLIDGLLNEMELTQNNKDILFQAIKGFSDHSCPRGLEIVFNWRGADGSLEILFLPPGQPVIRNVIDVKGVGRDFIAQFFLGAEPVTPNFKVAVGQAWPAFLLGGDEPPDAQSPTASKPSLFHRLESKIPSFYLRLLGKIRLPGWRPHTQRTPGQQRFRVMMQQANASRTAFGTIKDSVLEFILLILVILLSLPPSLSFSSGVKKKSGWSSTSGGTRRTETTV